MAIGQTNIKFTNPVATDIVAGNFNPADYAASTPLTDLYVIDSFLVSQINTDSLFQFLSQMSSFGNRNTGSDTLSPIFGIGAAQRWALSKFADFSARNENRLIPTYLQFDQNVCGMGRHKNTCAVLPGSGPQFDEVVLIEAHYDSRCETGCDVSCLAEGMEDNGSGSALVMELARVMSQFSYNRTIVFMLTTGEEQGLVGANAFSQYAVDTDMKIMGVLNNDVIGGVVCGETASPPGCIGVNEIDSINVRIFSAGTINSQHKQLARYSKLQFYEMARELMDVKPIIRILTPEDRTGRGGDHIPFREDGFPAIRFTSANEHGNANAGDPDYHDRQHTMRDILGVDTDNNGTLDSLFVNLNYLSRNAIINGSALASLASSPIPPINLDIEDLPGGFIVSFEDTVGYDAYRIAVRLFDENDWDTLITTTATTDTIYGLPHDVFYAVSVMSIDENGIESTASNEEWGSFESTTLDIYKKKLQVELIQNRPNPFDEATVIGIILRKSIKYNQAALIFHTTDGNAIANIPVKLQEGLNEVVYDYQYHNYIQGTYLYSLVIDGIIIDTKSMTYAY